MLQIGRAGINRTFLVATAAITIAVFGCGFYLLVTQSPSAALLAWSGAIATAILLVPVMLRREFDIGEPLAFVLVATLVGVTLKSAYVYLSARDEVVGNILFGRAPEDLLHGMLLVLVGVSAFCLGYSARLRRLNLRRTLLATRTELGPARFALASIVVIAAAAIAALLFVREFGFVLAGADLADLSGKRFINLEGSEHRAALGYHRWVISLTGVLFCIALAYATRERGFSRLVCGLVAVITAAMAIGFAVFASSRGAVVVLAAAGLLIVYYMRGRISFARAGLVIGVCAALLVAITVLRPARVASEIEAVSMVDELIEITVGGRHFLDLGKTTQVALAVPEIIPFQSGRTLVSWVFAPVPRAVWLDKPAVGVGPLLGREIYGMGTRGGVPPGFVAELYLNFHLPGVALGMFLLGLFLRWMYESFRPMLLAGNPNAVALYAMVVQTSSIQLLTADFSKFMVELFTQVLPLLAIVVLIARRPRTARTG